MTSQQNHPITPPPELVQQWIDATKSPGCVDVHLSDWEQRLATQAARWGADQELEECCEFLDDNELCDPNFHKDLRAVRRPKPPSLKEQALRILVENGTTLDGRIELEPDDIGTIRRALEQLND